MKLEGTSLKTELKRYLMPDINEKEYELLKKKLTEDFGEDAVAGAEKLAKEELDGRQN